MNAVNAMNAVNTTSSLFQVQMAAHNSQTIESRDVETSRLLNKLRERLYVSFDQCEPSRRSHHRSALSHSCLPCWTRPHFLHPHMSAATSGTTSCRLTTTRKYSHMAYSKPSRNPTTEGFSSERGCCDMRHSLVAALILVLCSLRPRAFQPLGNDDAPLLHTLEVNTAMLMVQVKQ
jgi:hypothetical protein